MMCISLLLEVLQQKLEQNLVTPRLYHTNLPPLMTGNQQML